MSKPVSEETRKEFFEKLKALQDEMGVIATPAVTFNPFGPAEWVWHILPAKDDLSTPPSGKKDK